MINPEKLSKEIIEQKVEIFKKISENSSNDIKDIFENY